MYDLPVAFDPQVFLGSTLEMVSFGIGTIHLEFELNPTPTPGKSLHASVVSIAVIQLIDGESTQAIAVGQYREIAKLGELLNERVTAARLTGPQSFQLHFGERRWVELAGEDAAYESYQLYLPGLGLVHV